MRIAVGEGAVEPDRVHQLASPAPAGRPGSSAACSSSGSAMIEPTVIRGFRLACGSWKIICIFGRSARSAPPSSRAMSLPSSSIAPAGRLVEPQDRPAGGRLAAARLADEAQRLARGDVEAHVVHRLDLGPPRAAARPCRSGSTSSARATRTSGARLRRHGAAPRSSASHQQAASCPGPTGSRGGFSTRQRLKTCAQRGANGQDRGSAISTGGWPSMVRSRRSRGADHARHGAEQRPGVGMLRIGEDLRHRPLLDHVARVHHHHPVGDAGHQPEVVGDPDDPHAEPAGAARARSRGSAPGW